MLLVLAIWLERRRSNGGIDSPCDHFVACNPVSRSRKKRKYGSIEAVFRIMSLVPQVHSLSVKIAF